MDLGAKKRQVTYEQLKILLEFLKEHTDLAKGLTRGRRGRLQTLKVWNSCAKLLNVCKNGAVKDGKGWSKYWCDWKYRVRRRALELKAAEISNKSHPDGITQLSAMEKSILNIIGQDSIDGVVIKIDPLAEGAMNENILNQDEEVGRNQFHNVQPSSSNNIERKRRHSSKDESESDNRSELSTSQSHDRKLRSRSMRRDCTVQDMDDEALQFLELERNKFELSKRRTESLNTIGNELSRLTDVLTNIRDVMINNTSNNVI